MNYIGHIVLLGSYDGGTTAQVEVVRVHEIDAAYSVEDGPPLACEGVADSALAAAPEGFQTVLWYFQQKEGPLVPQQHHGCEWMSAKTTWIVDEGMSGLQK